MPDPLYMHWIQRIGESQYQQLLKFGEKHGTEYEHILFAWQFHYNLIFRGL